MLPENILDKLGPLVDKLVEKKLELIEKILENSDNAGKIGSSPGDYKSLQRFKSFGLRESEPHWDIGKTIKEFFFATN